MSHFRIEGDVCFAKVPPGFEIRYELAGLYPDCSQNMAITIRPIPPETDRTMVWPRAIPRDQAKGEILDLFKKAKGSLFYSDIAEQLNLDLELVVELCNELEGDGHVGVLKPYERWEG